MERERKKGWHEFGVLSILSVEQSHAQELSSIYEFHGLMAMARLLIGKKDRVSHRAEYFDTGRPVGFPLYSNYQPPIRNTPR